MKPNEMNRGKRWPKQAESDLDDAKFAFSGNRFNLACFLAQHWAEKKPLKAISTLREQKKFGVIL